MGAYVFIGEMAVFSCKISIVLRFDPRTKINQNGGIKNGI